MNIIKKIIRPYYRSINGYLIQKLFSIKVTLYRRKGFPLKIVIGSSGKFQKDWMRSEKEFLNLLKEDDWNKYFNKGQISNLLAEHVWEHLSLEEGKRAASICYKYLKRGGKLRIAVPDGYHNSSSYIEQVKPGGFGVSADDHKILYNYKNLRSLLEEVGFKVDLLEYFDEEKIFHFQKWKIHDGMIRRSLKFDHRNKDGKPRYTSIIIDAIKEN